MTLPEQIREFANGTLQEALDQDRDLYEQHDGMALQCGLLDLASDLQRNQRVVHTVAKALWEMAPCPATPWVGLSESLREVYRGRARQLMGQFYIRESS